MRYRIKGWAKFQHFKDRKPVWIKLYRELLDDMEWHELDGESAKVLVNLWLIASENDGNLPENKKLAFRLRMTEKACAAACIKLSHWLEQLDNELISTGYQVDALEKRREEKIREEGEGETFADETSAPTLELEKGFGKDAVAAVCEYWNGTIAEPYGLAKVVRLSPTRRKKIQLRLRECGDDLKFFRVIDSIAKQPFLLGKNNRGWKADFDWVLEPSNFLKIEEGKFNDTH